MNNEKLRIAPVLWKNAIEIPIKKAKLFGKSFSKTVIIALKQLKIFFPEKMPFHLSNYNAIPYGLLHMELLPPERMKNGQVHYGNTNGIELFSTKLII